MGNLTTNFTQIHPPHNNSPKKKAPPSQDPLRAISVLGGRCLWRGLRLERHRALQGVQEADAGAAQGAALAPQLVAPHRGSQGVVEVPNRRHAVARAAPSPQCCWGKKSARQPLGGKPSRSCCKFSRESSICSHSGRAKTTPLKPLACRHRQFKIAWWEIREPTDRTPNGDRLPRIFPSPLTLRMTYFAQGGP